MRRFLTLPFATLRPPPRVAGQQGPAVPHLVDPALRCAPLDPVDEDTARRMREQLGRDVRTLETYVAGEPDIREGDVLAARGRSYPVRRVERWEWRGAAYLRLLVEEL